MPCARACAHAHVCHRALELGKGTAEPSFSAHDVDSPSKKARLKFGSYLPPVPGSVTKTEHRRALNMRGGFSPAQASISICKQRNNVCARAGFLSKTPRGFVPSSEPGGPAPGKQLLVSALDFESLLWLWCSGAHLSTGSLFRRCLVVELGSWRQRKCRTERIRNPVVLCLSAKRPSWP